MPFSFTVNGNQKLQGTGKVEWTQDDGKVAGLQFTDVSPEFQNALMRWLEDLSAPARPSPEAHSEVHWTKQKRSPDNDQTLGVQSNKKGFDRDLSSEPVPPTAIDNSKARAHGSSAASFIPSLISTGPSGSSAAAENSIPALPLLRDWEYPKGLGDREPRRGLGGVAVVGILTCLLAAAMVLFGYHQDLGQSLISLGEKISPSSGPPPPPTPAAESMKPATEAPATAQTQTEQTQTAVAPNDNKVQASQDSGATSRRGSVPENSFSGPNADRKSSNSPPANEDVTAARPWESRFQDSADQARILWAAVQQGNTSAEVTLAKLYLIGGGGVKKNCDQARVLLRAAARKGNVEASDKLSQIIRHGCP